MTSEPFANVPAPHPACRVTVVIPALNEAEHLPRTLAALVGQRDVDGSPLAPQTYDVLVYANNCTDATADVVRSFALRHPRHAVYVAEQWLPANIAHIGTARCTAMNAAAARFAGAGALAVLAGTDADTIPSPTWLAWTLREMRDADAVMGRILVDPAEWCSLPRHTRQMLLDENAYLMAVSHLASVMAPTSHDPWPRHWQRSGPSFAVRVDAYEAVGGVPPVRVLEDIALYDALEQRGARIRHSLRVRVRTSARLASRAAGGFGTWLAEWNAQGPDGSPLLVEHPETTVARMRGEATLPCVSRPHIPAAAATALLHQRIARGDNAKRATRNSVASIAG